jgi:hypothetical protein
MEADGTPLNVRSWSFRDVYTWFIRDQPLHDHFFRNHVPNWDGGTILELANITQAEKLHEALEKAGYGQSRRPLRDQMVQGIYRLKRHYKAFQRANPTMTPVVENGASLHPYQVQIHGAPVSRSIIAQTVNQVFHAQK